MGKYKSLFKIRAFLKNKKGVFFVGLITLIISSVIYAPVPYLMGVIIDKISLINNNPAKLYSIFITLIIIYISGYTLSVISQNIFVKLNNYLVNEMRYSIMSKVIDLPIDYLAKKEKGYIQSRISECAYVGNLFSPTYTNIFSGIFNCVWSIIIMLSLNYKLTLIVIILCPIFFIVTNKSSNKLSKNTQLMLESNGILNGETFEILNGIEDIKILNGKKEHMKKFSKKINEVVKNSINQGRSVTFCINNISLVNNVATLLILLVSAIMIIGGEITIGLYTAFSVYSTKIFSSIQSFTSIHATLKPICVSVERIYEILELKDENSQDKPSLKEEITSLELKNLSFKYNKKDKFILKSFNCKINKGDKILLKGSNGSGKSTLIKIILGLYHPDYKSIYINNKNYCDFNLPSIRRKIGIVSQNIILFKGTVLDNILYGQRDKSKEDVVNLMKKYKLENYINNLPNGLDTLIQDAAGVSGGQKQIIAFIRAILSKKDIIILDEAVTNIDVETRSVVFKILKENNLANILIIVSHQKDEIDFLNKVVSLD